MAIYKDIDVELPALRSVLKKMLEDPAALSTLPALVGPTAALDHARYLRFRRTFERLLRAGVVDRIEDPDNPRQTWLYTVNDAARLQDCVADPVKLSELAYPTVAPAVQVQLISGQTVELSQNDLEQASPSDLEQGVPPSTSPPESTLLEATFRAVLGLIERMDRVEVVLNKLVEAGVLGPRQFSAVNGNKRLCCSFCAKNQHQVSKLIEGPNKIYICSECIEASVDILEENEGTAKEANNGPDQ